MKVHKYSFLSRLTTMMISNFKLRLSMSISRSVIISLILSLYLSSYIAKSSWAQLISLSPRKINLMIGDALQCEKENMNQGKLQIKGEGNDRLGTTFNHATQALLTLAAARDPDPVRKKIFLDEHKSFLKQYINSCRNWKMKTKWEPYDAAYSLRALVSLRNIWSDPSEIDKSIEETIDKLIWLQKENNRNNCGALGFWNYGTDYTESRTELNGSVTLTVVGTFQFCMKTMNSEQNDQIKKMADSIKMCKFENQLNIDPHTDELEFNFDGVGAHETLGVTALVCMDSEKIKKNLDHLANHNLKNSGQNIYFNVNGLIRNQAYTQKLFELSELLQRISSETTFQVPQNNLELCLLQELGGDEKSWWKTANKGTDGKKVSIDGSGNEYKRAFKILACENYYSCLTPVMQSARLVPSSKGEKLYIHLEGASLKGTIWLVPQININIKEAKSIKYNQLPQIKIGEIVDTGAKPRLFTLDVNQNVMTFKETLEKKYKNVKWTVWFEQDVTPSVEAWSFLYEK